MTNITGKMTKNEDNTATMQENPQSEFFTEQF